MRHLWTLIAAAVIAPLAWVLLAYGQDRSIQAFLNEESAGAFRSGDFIRPALCLAAAGLLLGLLGTLRVSPAGAVLTGLVYTGSFLALLADPDTVLNLLPGRMSLAGREADLETPLRTGSAMVVGAALLLAVASAGRWRRAATREEAAVTVGGGAPLTLPDNRPLGADGLGLPGTPLSGEVLGGVPLRPDLDPNRGPLHPADLDPDRRPFRDADFDPDRGPFRDADFDPDRGPFRDADFDPDRRPLRDADPDADRGPGWSRTPVSPGWSNQRTDVPPARQRRGHWEEAEHESGPEWRRWPTAR
ncbi:hypothetical protein RB614_05490 [Phytohabitans sp. ZYX-F-186]|uniref:Uncharacterized protein n=1 Tax=Phytohabitans maris TaxID=3071409 RepID=A0ABU0ZA93_9ACTN|nr:hypothetical protein [Phytohabitans sp. ZYX-F-186]MDQ7903975.1 hypothetical protein [Phytohabitans sp. ZYX-F-186]